MITKLLIAGAAIAALTAGGATAATRHHHHHHMRGHHMRGHHRHGHGMREGGGGSFAAPAQPIPYSQLDSYLHSSASQRRSMEMAPAPMGETAQPMNSTTSPGADTSVPASGMANPTTGPTAAPNPNNPSDQVPTTGPDTQGAGTPPPPPPPPNSQ